MCDWREREGERERDGGRQADYGKKDREGDEVREADRVELRQMSGIDEACSDADTQAELQPDELIPSCSLCFFASNRFWGESTKSGNAFFLCVIVACVRTIAEIMVCFIN